MTASKALDMDQSRASLSAPTHKALKLNNILGRFTMGSHAGQGRVRVPLGLAVIKQGKCVPGNTTFVEAICVGDGFTAWVSSCLTGV